MRISVQNVLSMMAGDMSHEQILEEFADLTKEDLLACLAFAADREQRFQIGVPK
jgi:uncharacterized protein (DUF433 family)